eukprot:TRINITY_DN51314_c0_g1_i1.p1 TRINITY_DN51314_c0_g1~~TRINITY_DN51314_c0_g1_i1.p1  ORF type:complete len:433 (+),score=44.53 TRINITY_DN51314_c0_g1_i1:31-1299(+)
MPWWDAIASHAWPSVDLLVRSYAGDTAQLLLLMRSVELYWPTGKWGVVVILDQEPFDAAVALALPSFARVVLEQLPPLWDEFPAIKRRVRSGNSSDVLLEQRSRGYVRGQWSHFYADRYSQAEFVAWVDADCVLFTYVTPSLLFEVCDGVQGPHSESCIPTQGASVGHSSFHRRPLVGCVDVPMMYFKAIRALGWPWVCEFMSGFPFVLHRKVFSTARAAIYSSYWAKRWLCEKKGLHTCDMPALDTDPGPSTLEFTKAFSWLGAELQKGFEGLLEVDYYKNHALLPGAPTILGHVAYLWERTRHSFSVHPGHNFGTEYEWPGVHYRQMFPVSIGPEGIPDYYRCPALRSAIHLGYWSLYDKTVYDKYFKFGVHLMMVGQCGDESWPLPDVARVLVAHCVAMIALVLSGCSAWPKTATRLNG